MSPHIQTEHFTKALYALLDETFDSVHGYFLDRGTSMFETLATISAEDASVPVGAQCATLAAQIKHTDRGSSFPTLVQAVTDQPDGCSRYGGIWPPDRIAV